MQSLKIILIKNLLKSLQVLYSLAQKVNNLLPRRALVAGVHTGTKTCVLFSAVIGQDLVLIREGSGRSQRHGRICTARPVLFVLWRRKSGNFAPPRCSTPLLEMSWLS